MIDINPPIRAPWIAKPPSQTARKEGIWMMLFNSDKEVKSSLRYIASTQKLRNKLWLRLLKRLLMMEVFH